LHKDATTGDSSLTNVQNSSDMHNLASMHKM